MLNKKIITLILGASLATPIFASTEIDKKPEPTKFDAETSQALLKTFAYSPNKVFEIQTRVGMWTNIVLPEDEVVVGFLPSDTTFWNAKVTKDRKRVMMRPIESERFNSASIVTNKHTYELTFKSYGKGSSWYQRISWKFNEDSDPAFGIFSGDAVNLTRQGNLQESKPLEGVDETETADPTNWEVDISKAHFNYEIENPNRAKFAPIRVFDDGTFTYIQMPKTQDLPALFAIGEDEGIRLVDYVVKNNYILVNRVLPGLVFRLNEQEVVVRRYE